MTQGARRERQRDVTEQLDRDRLVEVALRLLDQVGLEGLTTRRLAARLGIKSPSLYWHLRSKDELLQLVAERIAAEVTIPERDQRWRRRLEVLMLGFRAALHAHRDAALLFARAVPVGPNLLTIAESALGALLDAGLGDDEALDGIGILVGYVTGSVVNEVAPMVVTPTTAGYSGYLAGQSTERYPQLTRLASRLDTIDYNRQFENGMRVLLDGLEARASMR